MTQLPRALDDRGGWIHLDLDGLFFAVDASTRRVCWSDPQGPALMTRPGFRTEVLGPETYNHVDVYYDGPLPEAEFILRPVEDLREGDLVTWEGCLRRFVNTVPGRHGHLHAFVDHPTYPGPYPRSPGELVPVHDQATPQTTDPSHATAGSQP
ncbi:hypothetical protein ACIBUR_38750 [Streptomyces anulatus]